MKNIPLSTYRIQFNKDYTFKDALKIIDYLKELGISTLYASPIFKAKKGSGHGYDVTDPNTINPEIGTIEELYELSKKLKQNNITWLQDIVPNHMSYSPENIMLVDLFENGSNSRFYNYFDIDWNHLYSSANQRLLAPFLGKFYQEVLESRELLLNFNEDGFGVSYYETRMPIRMDCYPELLSFKKNMIRRELGREHPEAIRFFGIMYMLSSLPASEEIDERYYQIAFAKSVLYELYSSNEVIKKAIDDTIEYYNGKEGDPKSLDNLDSLLSKQYFRLAFWKVANEEINYRRFFNINELISMKVESNEVYNYTHKLISKLYNDKIFSGLRIDHIDGLYNPTAYLDTLQENFSDAYIVAEKILELNEELPEEWSIEGTTGYEFANYVNGLFCKKSNKYTFDNLYSDFILFKFKYHELIHKKKRLIIKTTMAGDVERLAFLIEKISAKDRYGIDFTMHGLKQALTEILTYFPVYRTYIHDNYISKNDLKYIDDTFKIAKRKSSRYLNEYNYIYNLLTQSHGVNVSDERKSDSIDFIMKFQQLTGPIMAKGFEDTTLYLYNRLISLNEVGGNPGKFGISKKEFHTFNRNRALKYPHNLNSTSTHDTKRGENVRSRINVLSEIPEEFKKKIKHWNMINRQFKKLVDGINLPVRNDEYFIYQTIIGSYPTINEDLESYPGRIKEYFIKAVREAKVYSAWIKPDEEYEKAISNFIDCILSSKEFLNDFIPFQKKILFYGMFNAFSQVLIKCTSPGIPDFYQGSELWNFSLVDPDNRRPVDYELRIKLLKDLKNFDTSKILEDHLGKTKMFIIHKALNLRNKYPDLFLNGNYKSLIIEGKYKNHIIAFERTLNNKTAIVIGIRFLTSIIKEGQLPLGDIWEDTFINLRKNFVGNNVLSNETISSEDRLFLKDVLKSFPVGLLISN